MMPLRECCSMVEAKSWKKQRRNIRGAFIKLAQAGGNQRSVRGKVEASPRTKALRLRAPVAKHAESIDFNFADIAGLEKDRRLACLAHAWRRAGEQDIPRLERDYL